MIGKKGGRREEGIPPFPLQPPALLHQTAQQNLTSGSTQSELCFLTSPKTLLTLLSTTPDGLISSKKRNLPSTPLQASTIPLHQVQHL